MNWADLAIFDRREQILRKPQSLLLLAGVFHLLFTTAIFIAGKHQLLPSLIDENGTAFSIVADGTDFIKDADDLGDDIRHGNISSWVNQSYSFHVKIYSLSFAVFSPLFGRSILDAEPFNLLYYLGILILVYKLTTQISDRLAGVIAASIAAVWPSLLLHSSQMSKDTLFICEMLLLCLVLVRILRLTYTDRTWLFDVCLGGLSGLLLWKTRSDFAPMVLLTVGVAGLLLMVRYVRERRFLIPNTLVIAMILLITLSAMFSLSVYRIADHPRLGFKHPARHRVLKWWQVAEKVGTLRDGFMNEYRLSGSNVGTEVRITNWGELVAFFPKAAVFGLFTPFPSMWFETGTPTGPFARKVSGAETIVMYGIEILAVLAFWRGRRDLAKWLLMSVALSGAILLGLVVINVGALFRQRYFFVLLLIVLAAGQLASWVGSKDVQPTTLPTGNDLPYA
jgi:hypothetical protein